MKFFQTKYRIVPDCYLGYEAQFKPWFSPFWMQCNFSNTSSTLEKAQLVAEIHKSGGMSYLTDKGWTNPNPPTP